MRTYTHAPIKTIQERVHEIDVDLARTASPELRAWLCDLRAALIAERDAI